MNNDEKKMIVPKLRFPEFRDAGNWDERQLNKLGELVSGLTYSPDDVRDSGLLVLRSSNVQNGEITLDDNVYVTPSIKGANLSKANDILICVRNGSKALIGKNALIPEGMPLCTHGAFMTVFRTPSSKFVFQLFQGGAYQRQVDADLGATINSINGSQFLKYKFFVPSQGEQQKIADCLSSIDELISAQSQKVNALKIHKQGLMQRLFPTYGETIPRLRFPEFRDAGEWAETPLNQVAIRCKQKNSLNKLNRVLTNSAEFGVLDQRDFFDKDIANQSNLDGYYIVKKGDYVYNPRISKTAPVGPISKNNIGDGVMSPLYTVFRFNNYDNSFYAHYFNSTCWHHYMRQASSTGARHDRMAIANDDFMALPLPLTSPEEQKKIADCLSSIDELISVHSQKLDTLKTHKKGLMQQLFPAKDEANAEVKA